MNKRKNLRRDALMRSWAIDWWRRISAIGMAIALFISGKEKPSFLVIAVPLCFAVGALLRMGLVYTKDGYFSNARRKVKFLQRMMYLTTAVGVGLLGVVGIIGPREIQVLFILPGLFWVLGGAGGLLLEPEVNRLEEE